MKRLVLVVLGGIGAIIGLVLVAGLFGVVTGDAHENATARPSGAGIGVEPHVRLKGNGYCNLHQPYTVSTLYAIPTKVWVRRPVRIDIMVENHGPTMPLLAFDPTVLVNLTLRPLSHARIIQGVDGPIFVYPSPACGKAIRLSFTITAPRVGQAALIYFLYPRLIHGDDQGEADLVEQGQRRMMALKQPKR